MQLSLHTTDLRRLVDSGVVAATVAADARCARAMAILTEKDATITSLTLQLKYAAEVCVRVRLRLYVFVIVYECAILRQQRRCYN
jgi:hypothetical protein